MNLLLLESGSHFHVSDVPFVQFFYVAHKMLNSWAEGQIVIFALFALFPSCHMALILFSSLWFQLVLFLTSSYNFCFHFLTGSISSTFIFFPTVLVSFMCVYVCVYFPLFCQYLPDFVSAICLRFVVCFLFQCVCFIPFNAITNHLWYLTCPARYQAQNL